MTSGLAFKETKMKEMEFIHLPKKVISDAILIDLVTVFDAILTSRQTREKLQCSAP